MTKLQIKIIKKRTINAKKFNAETFRLCSCFSFSSIFSFLDFQNKILLTPNAKEARIFGNLLRLLKLLATTNLKLYHFKKKDHSFIRRHQIYHENPISVYKIDRNMYKVIKGM